MLRAVRLEQSRRSLLAFTQHTKPDYEVNWHHKLVCAALDRFVRGEVKRLMILMPPRHGKSELVSRRLPAYILGRNPDAAIISCSYSADLASRMNRDVQRVIETPEYAELFPDSQLYSDNVRTTSRGAYLRNSDIFEIVGHRGVYRSAGVGGGITGMGFNFGVIDDPIKNRKEANSPVFRESVWEWYTSTFYTRAEKDAGILLTVTRWHKDDLAGRLLLGQEAPSGEQWEVVSLPAIAEPERAAYDERESGAPLWAGKYDKPALETIRAALGAYDWSALYQQSPVATEGGLFKRDKLEMIDYAPADIVRTVRFWDLALSGRTSADFTVGVKMGITKGGQFIILDMRMFQKEWDDVVPEIAKVALQDGRDVHVGVEAAFYQTRAVGQLLRRPELFQFNVRGIKPDADKFTRALPLAARVGDGMVKVLRGAWSGALIDELCSFPLGAHDDISDSCAGAYLMLDKAQETPKATVTRYA